MESKHHADVAERFTNDIEKHEMTVLKDDGLYRHLVFREPGSSFFWFEIITWPDSLVINGDMQTFVFRRTEDMFAFFNQRDINPGYWAEKCVAGKTKEYSEARFKQIVEAYVADFISEEEVEPAFAQKLRETVDEVVFGDERVIYDGGAHEVLAEFRDFEKFVFQDAWEWDFTDWVYQYLWCCFGIVHAVRTYNEWKKEQGE